MNTVGRWIIALTLCAAVYPICQHLYFTGAIDSSSYYFGYVVATAQAFVFTTALNWGKK